VRFYWEVFRAPLVGVSEAPADRVAGFFGVPGGGSARSAGSAFRAAR